MLTSVPTGIPAKWFLAHRTKTTLTAPDPKQVERLIKLADLEVKIRKSAAHQSTEQSQVNDRTNESGN
jgi:hypothetical protein